MSRPRRPPLLPALAAALTLLAWAGPAAAQGVVDPFGADAEIAPFEEAGLQELLLDLRFGRLSRATVRAFSDGAVALLPAGVVFDAAELDHRYEPGGALVASLYPGPRQIRVEGDSARATLDGEMVEGEDGWIVPDGAGEIYVATPILEELLGVAIVTDWVNLAVVILDPSALPVGQRLAREARWDNLRGGGASDGARPLLDLKPTTLGGAVLDWGVSGTASDPRSTTAYSAGLAARLWGGSLRVSSRSVGPAAQGSTRFDATYQAVFHDRDWISQMRLGDGFTTGPRLRDMRGFSLTNAPYLRGSYFGRDEFSGRVGPGWEVELRQSGRVLDLTRADEQGAFALDIPLRYGENAIQVVAFGPHGQVITTDRLFLLGTDRIPGGRFEWGLSGGECRSERCRATGNLDLRYGLSDRWTIRAGAEGFTRDTLSSVVQPYLGITGMITQSLAVSLEGVRAGFLRTGATVAPSPWLRVRGAHTLFSSFLDEPLLHDARRLHTTEADVFIRPDRGNARLFLRGSLLRQALSTGDVSSYQASLTVPMGNLGLETGIRREVDRPETGPRFGRDFQFSALTGMIPLARGHSLWVRGELEFLDASAVDRARAQIAYQLSEGTRLEIGVGWHQLLGSNLTISFSAYLSQMRSVTQVVGREHAQTQLLQYSQGTVHWNEATQQASLAPGPGLERGGIAGYVFLDSNGNGMRDVGEQGLEDVRLVVGGRVIRTDASGRHSAWDLVPFEPVEIWADSSSIQDPTLVPAWGPVQVRVPPASFGRVDIPVTRSREIVGRVVRVADGAEIPIPYARLWLVDTTTRQVRRLQAFSDGEFYEAGIRPGQYELRLAPPYAQQTDLLAEEGWAIVDVAAGDGRDVVGPIVLRVRFSEAARGAG